MEETASDTTINRRRVLQGIGTTGAATATSGLASANTGPEFSDEEVAAAKDGYQSLDAVKSALSEEEAMLEALAEEGVINSPSVDALGIKSLGMPNSDADMNVTIWPAKADGNTVTEITVDGELNGLFTSLRTQPNTKNAIAFVDRDAIFSAGSSGCDDDCDNCEYTCYTVNKTSKCDGSYRSEPDYYCDDGW
ncbi:hypothetical protein [Haloarcula sp. K1]|uniref:hypothetical protein n=1 Tax=Haloarcula sp. K1 TaxID=1622207 RepID=UPI0012BA7F98|nr:hypothetical protein [Haloarcula sp. K1]